MLLVLVAPSKSTLLPTRLPGKAGVMYSQNSRFPREHQGLCLFPAGILQRQRAQKRFDAPWPTPSHDGTFRNTTDRHSHMVLWARGAWQEEVPHVILGNSSLKRILLHQQQSPHMNSIPGLQLLFRCFVQQVPGCLGNCFFFRIRKNKIELATTVSPHDLEKSHHIKHYWLL